MSFLSGAEDFQLRTLGSIPSALERLAYVTELRSRQAYEHWGMARTYGTDVAQAAIAENHSQVFVEVLSTGMEELLRQLESCGGEPRDRLELLRARFAAAVPAATQGANASHLNFVLETLSLLAGSSRASIRPAA